MAVRNTIAWGTMVDNDITPAKEEHRPKTSELRLGNRVLELDMDNVEVEELDLKMDTAPMKPPKVHRRASVDDITDGQLTQALVREYFKKHDMTKALDIFEKEKPSEPLGLNSGTKVAQILHISKAYKENKAAKDGFKSILEVLIFSTSSQKSKSSTKSKKSLEEQELGPVSTISPEKKKKKKKQSIRFGPNEEFFFCRENPPNQATKSIEEAFQVQEQLKLDPEYNVPVKERFVELASSDVSKYRLKSLVSNLGADGNVTGVVHKVFGTMQCGTGGPGTIIIDTEPEFRSSEEVEEAEETEILPLELTPVDDALGDLLNETSCVLKDVNASLEQYCTRSTNDQQTLQKNICSFEDEKLMDELLFVE